ncbi:MAG: ABC transporter permease [Thermoplasmata archaeon]|nr:ABC transporter permease [Thermoplasmata archaeon]MCI4353850.1 ABC transporter permease [Thermoplasmata archaeon]
MRGRGGARHLPGALAAVLSASLLALFVLPLVAIASQASVAAYAHAFADPGVRLSVAFTLYASSLALLVSLGLGVPLGYLLARRSFRGRAIVESIVGLPIVVPHLVAGLALLFLFAPSTPVGAFFKAIGLPAFGSLFGVVLVMTYVSAPYTVLASLLAFRAVDERVLEAARSLGASPQEAFATVTLPLAARGIIAGALLTWARSVSEIGGFLILAYTVYPGPGYPGPVTTPISLEVYNLYQIGDLAGAAAVASLFVLLAFAIFLAVRWIERGGGLPWRRGELGA